VDEDELAGGEAAMPRPARGSAHYQPTATLRAGLRARPANRLISIHLYSIVRVASATTLAEATRWPTRHLNVARVGMT
jgi:hypothetical protein